MTTYWPVEREEKLRSLLAQPGITAGQIAAELHITRNAVLGKIHREGWAPLWVHSTDGQVRELRKAKPPRPRQHRRSNVASTFNGIEKPVAPTPEKPPPRRDVETPRRQRRTLHELDANTCRWPIGEPGTPLFFFCGAPPLQPHPYCGKHCKVAWSKNPTQWQKYAT